MTSCEQPTLGCASFFTVGISLRLILRELPGGESSLALFTSFTQVSIRQHGTSSAMADVHKVEIHLRSLHRLSLRHDGQEVNSQALQRNLEKER